MKTADLPDWTGKTFVSNAKLDVEVINSQLDVNVTNSTLDVNVTNSTLPVEVQNSSLDVNVTNSSLAVTVEGTADVNIQNAQLNVQTLREQASVQDKVTFASDLRDLGDSTAFYSGVDVYTNNTGGDVYLEQITAAVYANTSSPSAMDRNQWAVVIDIFTGSSIRVRFVANIDQFPLNFDPAIPVHDGESIRVACLGNPQSGYYLALTTIIRTP